MPDLPGTSIGQTGQNTGQHAGPHAGRQAGSAAPSTKRLHGSSVMAPASRPPTVPSDSVGRQSASTTRPAATDCRITSLAAGWQPTTRMAGSAALSTLAMPAARPPPPTGTNTAARVVMAQLGWQRQRQGVGGGELLSFCTRLLPRF